jgi:hypothetical protein
MLSSAAADLNITQLVDGNKGVHAMIPVRSLSDRRVMMIRLLWNERLACTGLMHKVTVTAMVLP